tara:strand:- start:86 stop:1579 length:1494 start_codon:yes stop_codon:yes gene_type:complete
MHEKIIEVVTTPDPSLQSKLAQSGHSFHEAAAELFDNCIDAHATDINIDISHAQKAKYNIVISDNGVGMNLEELTDAITLAKSSKSSANGDLGLFGLGMKTSLGALGRLHEIETTKKGSTKKYIYRNDEKVIKTKHSADIIVKDDAPKNDSGTIVKIGELHFQTKARLQILKEKTARRYSKILGILGDDRITITINNTKIQPVANKFDKNIPQIEGTFTFNDNSYPYFFGYLADQRAQSYGINLYKNLRIIEEEKKDVMGLRGSHQHERGVYGEIFMNDFDTDHTKTQFLRSDRWCEFEKVVKKELRAWRSQVNKYNANKHDAHPVTRDTKNKIDDNLKKMARYLNETEILDDLDFNTIEKSDKENDTLKIVPEANPTTSEPKSNSLSTATGTSGSKSKGANPSTKWKVGGVLFEMKYHIEDLQDLECIKTWDLVNETTLNAIINNGGRVYNHINEKSVFITQEIVDAFIRCLIEKKGVTFSKGFEIRDSILNAAYL